MTSLFDVLANARVFDLAQPYYQGMPHSPGHPPFLFGLTKLHGEYVGANGASSVSDSMALSGHSGTHIDALCHFSSHGALYGGVAAAGVQSYSDGMARHSIDNVAPILRRGVLLDLARLHGGPLPEDFEVTPAHLKEAERSAGVELRAGDVALLRTGWGAWWDDAARFVNQTRGPGPSGAGARWLSGRGVFAAGSDTVAFEKMPGPAMPAHIHLLVESGIHIVECLNLEELAETRVYEFLFVAAPLKIRGGTASPIRPLAVAVAK
jgi:kynurenine formamidase